MIAYISDGARTAAAFLALSVVWVPLAVRLSRRVVKGDGG